MALERIGDEIAELSADLHAAEYRLLCLIREFDEGRGWVYQGARSCAQWLSWRTGIDGGAARERVRVARALGNLPRISEALSRGAISYSKVRAVTRIASAENEETLLRIALQGTASQVERMVRAWRKASPAEEGEAAKFPRKGRPFSMRQEEDGSWVVRGRLSAEVGAALLEALQAAEGASFEEEREGGVSAETSSSPKTDGRTQADQRVIQEASPMGQAVLEPSGDVSAETSRRMEKEADVVEECGTVLEAGRKRRIVSLQAEDWRSRSKGREEWRQEVSQRNEARLRPNGVGPDRNDRRPQT